jgi:5-methylcytosine-specific restriction endonuclease McrA
MCGMPTRRTPDPGRLDRIVAQARREADERARTYRDQALRLLPWICTRCAREFDRANLQLLTVHHRDGNHHHNPADGSNWELLCVYCHENEHAREHDNDGRSVPAEDEAAPATHRPFANLEELLRRR